VLLLSLALFFMKFFCSRELKTDLIAKVKESRSVTLFAFEALLNVLFSHTLNVSGF